MSTTTEPIPVPPKSRLVQRQLMVIVLASILTFFSGLGVPALWDQDEGFFAATAQEMHERGDWIVPTFNGELFGHKPPFMFWMMRVGFALFGVNELGARFFSACFGLATAVLTFTLGRMLWKNTNSSQIQCQTHGRKNEQLLTAPFLAGLCMASCLMFGVVSRAATPDSYLVFWITLALWAYVRSVLPALTGSHSPALHDLLPKSIVDWCLIYGAMGVAVLVKGPIGVLLPGCTIGLFLILATASASTEATGWRRMLTWIRSLFGPLPWVSAWKMRPFLAIAVVLLIAGPWFALVGWETNGRFLAEFFGTHNFGRFLQPMDNHRGSIFYYLPATLAGFFPWSIFAIPVAWHAIRSVMFERRIPLVTLFLLCWAVVMLGFFSLASTKLPSYVLPVYPALALLTAEWLAAFLRRESHVGGGWPVVSWGILASVGVAMTLAIPALGWTWNGQLLALRANLNPSVLAETIPLMSIGMVPLGTGLFALWCLRRQDRSMALASFGAGSVTFCVALLAGGAMRVDQHQFTAEMVQIALSQHATTTPVATFCYFQPSMVFYSTTPVERLEATTAAEAHLEQHGTLLLTTSGLEVFRQQSRLPVEVVASRPNFPKPGELLLIRAAVPQGIEQAQRSSGPGLRDSLITPATYTDAADE